MDVKYLASLPKDQAYAFIKDSLEKLKSDYDLNIRDDLFVLYWDKQFSFEEFLVMMVIEKDLEVRSRSKRK